MIKNKVLISQSDYNELNGDNSRWTLEQYCYWIAKFKSGYAPEGYGMWNVRLLKEGDSKIGHDYEGKEIIYHNINYYITWECRENCD